MSDRIKANAIAIALGSITGTIPTIFENNGKYNIYWDSSELPKVQKYIENQLDLERKSGNITVEYKTAILPVLIKRYSPIVLISSATLLFIGYNLKKRKK